jgi:hypothetical protein
VLDESDVPLTPTSQADVRKPISSSCTANPFSADGTACQGGALGTPFFLFTSGSVNPEGASVSAFFQFGTTTAYGQATAAQRLGPDDGSDTFTASLSTLPGGAPIHYRTVAMTDFSTVVGEDRTGTCRDGTSCRVLLMLTLRGRRIIAVTAAKTVKLKRAGRRLLAARHRAPATLTVNQRRGGSSR